MANRSGTEQPRTEHPAGGQPSGGPAGGQLARERSRGGRAPGALSDPIANDVAYSSFSTLSSLLWTERGLLEDALFRVTTQRLMLATGDTRWLARSTDETQAALERISTADVMRAAELEALAATLHLPAGTTLADLAGLAPAPWAEILADHRAVLRSLTRQLGTAAEQVRTILRAGMSAIAQTLDRLDALAAPDAAASVGYDATGAVRERPAVPILLDRHA